MINWSQHILRGIIASNMFWHQQNSLHALKIYGTTNWLLELVKQYSDLFQMYHIASRIVIGNISPHWHFISFYGHLDCTSELLKKLEKY